MRGKLAGALAAAAAFLGTAGTAHAGYAHFEVSGGLGGDLIARFNAAPGELPNLRFQVADGGQSVIFEDLANPITVGPPPFAIDRGGVGSGTPMQPENPQPCELITAHKARCIGGEESVRLIQIDTGLMPAKVRDLSGSLERPLDLYTGPLNDDVELLHQAAVVMDDLGGKNVVRLASNGGWVYDLNNYVYLGPGASTVDVRNGVGWDYVRCLIDTINNQAQPPGTLELPLDQIFADANDVIEGCGNVQQ